VRSFEARANIRDRCDRLVLSTPDSVHEIDIELRALRHGETQPVLRLRGEATKDGRLQVVVTNVMAGEALVVDLDPVDHPTRTAV
jgi:hypothetical protein